jgi:hypothetical protein
MLYWQDFFCLSFGEYKAVISPSAQMTLFLHHLALIHPPSLDFLAQASLSVCSLIYFIASLLLSKTFHNILTSSNLPLSRCFITPLHHLSVHFTPLHTSTTYHHVLPSRRALLGMPMPLLQAQCRYVRGIWNTRSPGTRANSPRWIYVRKTFGLPTTRVVVARNILRLGLQYSKPWIA